MADKKIALITGGSRGIGRACSIGLAKDGFDIWLNYQNDDAAAERTCREIRSLGRNCHLMKFNVADHAQTDAILEHFLENATPYILVNNAGLAKDGMFGFMSAEDWNTVITVCLDGFFNVTRKLVPYMIHARKGRIISVSSISGQAGNAGQVNYSCAKAGLIGATKALAKELGPRGILVNAVAPGLIETDMTRDLPLAELRTHIPLRKPGTPEDVAGCVRFLCSDWANYVTGQVIAVNGGLYA